MKRKQSIDKSKVPNMEESRVDSMLSDLIYLGRATSTLSISGFDFELKTLTEEENREIVDRLLKIEESKRLVCVKAMTLAKCILKINNHDFDDFAKAYIENKDGSYEDIEIAKNAIILKLQTTVTDKLFTKYEELVKESRDSIELEKIKN